MSERTFTPDWLREDGFDGFSSIEDIRLGRSAVSPFPGVYVVSREQLGPTEFLAKSTGGWHKGKDPSVPIDELMDHWIDDAYVLYIGKADAGHTGIRGVRVRVDEYLRFGQGQPVGHRGGRYLWHVAGAGRLLICWKACSRPLDEESRLLDLFRSEYGALPFANLRGGSRQSIRGL